MGQIIKVVENVKSKTSNPNFSFVVNQNALRMVPNDTLI